VIQAWHSKVKAINVSISSEKIPKTFVKNASEPL
jgi:hypothetical protein